ncbi:MAG TPA: protein kinase [Thermoanaerobaculia bacterium]|nr:protein kinase [Thermoanaerobaculia bacterium]
MITGETTLERGRDAFRRRQWPDAYAGLDEADRESSLEPDDLDRLATCAYLTGRDDESIDLWARAHQLFLARENPQRAARSALWLAFGLLARGKLAPAAGWLARAGRILEHEGDCVEQGLALALNAIPVMFSGKPSEALPMFERAARIGERYGDPDVLTLGLLGQGDCLIRLGNAAAGTKLLDEVMVGVTAGETSPVLTGLVYCAVISACHSTFDLRRAHEWTEALTRWCESQAGLVAYRGVCLVHRAEILQLKGAWPTAVEEVRLACEKLSEPPGHSSVGSAYYMRGELHRLRGEFAEAEEAYRQASLAGRKPDPGLAELRLAQGQVEAAAAAIRRMCEETTDRRMRSRILPAFVDIMLATGDVEAAHKGSEQLSEIAGTLDAPYIRGVAARAKGAVLLAEGDPRAALAAFREAMKDFLEVAVPHDLARVRVLVALACRQLGDEETARLELDAARTTFGELGAAPELTRLDQLAAGPVSSLSSAGTPRPATRLRPGARLGPYEIVSSVGAGGMGEVFRARDTRLGRDVAVKIITGTQAGDSDSIRRFEKEARAVASLSHPNIVPLFDIGEQNGIRYAVCEFVEGETLRARLNRGPITFAEAVDIAAQIADGLSAAHEKGFVHRDIKPDNVVLARPDYPRILDFGLAKRSAGIAGSLAPEDEATQSAILTEPGIITGTVGYMSPEQVRGEPVDGRSDIFSLGVVLWEMLTGHRPFHGDSPVETLSAILREEPPPDPALAGLPSEFERVLRRCLQKKPEERYGSAADLALDLHRLATEMAPTSRRVVTRRRQGLGSAIRTWLRPSGGSRRSS